MRRGCQNLAGERPYFGKACRVSLPVAAAWQCVTKRGVSGAVIRILGKPLIDVACPPQRASRQPAFARWASARQPSQREGSPSRSWRSQRRLVGPADLNQKNDMADAEAICEAVTRANMRFVPTKTPEQQSCLMLHRTRHLFIRQQTAVINSIRAHLAEFGIVAPVGRKGVTELLHVVADPNDKRVPEVARACLAALGDSTAQPQGADFGVRSDDPGLAPVQPDEQAPSLHSRGRSDAGDRPGRECC